MDCLNAVLKELNDYEKKRTRKSKRNLKKQKIDKNVTLEKLSNIKTELERLNEMIGMEEVKETIAEHVVYLVQGLSSENEMNHIQICGEPGTGKTTLAEVMGDIYAGLGLLENGEVIRATRSDFVGDHLGSTTIKTEEVLYSCIGNVLLIDEVYSFGCQDKKDSFAKEAIDCINQFLSEHRDEVLCIIAGYEQDIKDCFFAMNRGLERRFPWKYVLKPYNMNQLREIFNAQIQKDEWKICDDVETTEQLNDIFSQRNVDLFNNYGGDIEVLVTRCKIAYSNRIFFRKEETVKMLSKEDIKKGFERFRNHKEKSKDKILKSMMYT